VTEKGKGSKPHTRRRSFVVSSMPSAIMTCLYRAKLLDPTIEEGVTMEFAAQVPEMPTSPQGPRE